MYGSIVKENKSVHLQVERKFIKETEDFICRHLFECCESIVTVITVNHSKDIESCHPLGGDINILPLQLPTVRDISFSTSVVLICIIEPNTSFRRFTFKFLQLLDFVFIELRRGYSVLRDGCSFFLQTDYPSGFSSCPSSPPPCAGSSSLVSGLSSIHSRSSLSTRARV